jgi:hypothetical protein
MLLCNDHEQTLYIGLEQTSAVLRGFKANCKKTQNYKTNCLFFHAISSLACSTTGLSPSQANKLIELAAPKTLHFVTLTDVEPESGVPSPSVAVTVMV